MSTEVLTLLVVALACAVVAALTEVMWLESRSSRDSRIAIAAGTVLVAWAVVAGTLAVRGAFVQPDAETAPPIGIFIIVVLAGLTASLAAAASLRRLLANQKNLIRINLWRLVGVVFLLLMARMILQLELMT